LEPVPASEKPLPPARESMRSLGFEGDALLGEVEAAMNTLRSLLDHSELLGEEVVTALRLTLAQVSWTR
jgi:hypothetical protein